MLKTKKSKILLAVIIVIVIVAIILLANLFSTNVNIVDGITKLANQEPAAKTEFSEVLVDADTTLPFTRIIKLTAEQTKLVNNLKYEDWVELDNKSKSYFTEMVIAGAEKSQYHTMTEKSSIDEIIATFLPYYDTFISQNPKLTWKEIYAANTIDLSPETWTIEGQIESEAALVPGYSENVTDSVTGETFIRIIKLTDKQLKQLNDFNSYKLENWEKLSDAQKNYFVELDMANNPDAAYHKETSRAEIEEQISSLRARFYDGTENGFAAYPDKTWGEIMDTNIPASVDPEYAEVLVDSETGGKFVRIIKLTADQQEYYDNMTCAEWGKLNQTDKEYYVELTIAGNPDHIYHTLTSNAEVYEQTSGMVVLLDGIFQQHPNETCKSIMDNSGK